ERSLQALVEILALGHRLQKVVLELVYLGARRRKLLIPLRQLVGERGQLGRVLVLELIGLRLVALLHAGLEIAVRLLLLLHLSGLLALELSDLALEALGQLLGRALMLRLQRLPLGAVLL